jgi:cell division protein FtsB
MMRRNRTQDTVKRRTRLFARAAMLTGGVFTVTLGIAFFFGDMGVFKYLQMRDHSSQLEQELKDLERTNTELKTEIRRTQNDPIRIEELARERLGFVRPRETVYQIIREPKRDAAGSKP